ncbi:transcriptional regulator [Marinobacter fuscus]|uniref:Transcriptional regulator n=1 Tax=Marinobacter fuscus TaxID=2109942 RepID=A0A2T1K5V1_9GAMM|nr:metalloregulator ArsR/SmtB family transcription factor [Marinobacter fuscus]PSF05133.1 transcriptional regulator [Marinobacter fuscus]
MKGQGFYSPASLFKALGDELRLCATLLIHQQGELCVCELMEAFAAPQSKVSRHLAALREARVLSTERRGQWVYYYLDPELPEWVIQTLEQTRGNNPDLLTGPLARLQAMADRPVASCS